MLFSPPTCMPTLHKLIWLLSLTQMINIMQGSNYCKLLGLLSYPCPIRENIPFILDMVWSKMDKIPNLIHGFFVTWIFQLYAQYLLIRPHILQFVSNTQLLIYLLICPFKVLLDLESSKITVGVFFKQTWFYHWFIESAWFSTGDSDYLSSSSQVAEVREHELQQLGSKVHAA